MAPLLPTSCSTMRKSSVLITATAALFLAMLLTSPAAAQEADTGLPDSDVADPWVNTEGIPICSADILPLVEVEVVDPTDPQMQRKITVQIRPNSSELCKGSVNPLGYTTMPPGINEPQKPVPMVERSVATYNETTDAWETTRQTVPDIFAVNKAWEAYNREVLGSGCGPESLFRLREPQSARRLREAHRAAGEANPVAVVRRDRQ